MSNILDAARDLQDKKPRTTEAALKALAEAGYACCVAGGYVRDMAFNQQPKDIDIIVMDFEGHGTEAIRFVMMGFFGFKDKTCTNEHYAAEGEHGRINAVYSFYDELRDMQVEVILYNSETLAGALSDFDFNINACWFTDSYMSPSCVEHPPTLTGLVWFDRARGHNDANKPTVVIKWREDLLPARERKMIKKFLSMDSFNNHDYLTKRLAELDSGDSF